MALLLMWLCSPLWAHPGSRPESHASGGIAAHVFDPAQSLPLFGIRLLLVQIYILLLAACALATAERLHHRNYNDALAGEGRNGFWQRTMRGVAQREHALRNAATGPRRTDKLTRFAFEGRIKIWPFILLLIRGALLFSLGLPAMVVWRTHTHLELTPGTVALPAAVLAAAALLARHTARAWGAVAISLVAGTAILLIFWSVFSPWMLSPLHLTPSMGAFMHTGKMALAGYLIGFSLIFATTLAMGADFTRAGLFDVPPLEHRHANPLHTPLPLESRKRLRIFAFSALIGIALAVSPLVSLGAGTKSPLPLIALVLAATVQIWGWRDKQLGLRQYLRIVPVIVAMSLLLWVLALARSTGSFSGAVGAAFLSWKGWILAPSTHIGNLVWHSGLAARLPFICACLLVMVAACLMLRRPPGQLWTILGHAPVWGWMLLAATIAAFYVSFFVGGPALAGALLVTVFTAFAFIWLERAETM